MVDIHIEISIILVEITISHRLSSSIVGLATLGSTLWLVISRSFVLICLAILDPLILSRVSCILSLSSLASSSAPVPSLLG